MNDSEFDQLLRMIVDDHPLPALFNQEVWQRIGSVEADGSSGITRFPPIISTIARPWGAVAGIAAMVTLGLWLGAATAPDSKDAQLVYAESISPFAQAHGK